MPVSLSLRYTAVSSPQLTVSSVARTSSFPVLAPAAGAVSHSETEGGSQRCPPSRAKPASPRQREPAHSCRVRTICSVVRVTLAAASANSSLRLAAPGAMPNTASMPTSCSSSMPVPICPATAMTGLPWRLAVSATPAGVLPNLVWKSMAPSPVNTTHRVRIVR